MRTLIGGLAGALLQTWGTVNHYLTFWPRLRVALAVAICAALAAAVEIAVLRRIG